MAPLSTVTGKKAMKTPNGYVIYRGPSLLDNNPIVVIAITKKSSNIKTGNVVQTYILVDNGIDPIANYKSLADSSICGDCPHRRGIGGACYVNIGQGVLQVYKALQKGNYPFDLEKASLLSSNRMVRLGTYGDPAAVPKYVWNKLLESASGNLGYTHQWKNNKANDIMDICMASADSESDRELAISRGYRTFRVRLESDTVMKGEFICPASKEANYKKTCNDCGACNGGINTRKGSPTIIVHGTLKSRFAMAV
jgi:hypothetical protein